MSGNDRCYLEDCMICLFPTNKFWFSTPLRKSLLGTKAVFGGECVCVCVWKPILTNFSLQFWTFECLAIFQMPWFSSRAKLHVEQLHICYKRISSVAFWLAHTPWVDHLLINLNESAKGNVLCKFYGCWIWKGHQYTAVKVVKIL